MGEVPDQIHPPSRSVPFDPLQSLLFGQPEVAQGMGPSEWGPVNGAQWKWGGAFRGCGFGGDGILGDLGSLETGPTLNKGS